MATIEEQLYREQAFARKYTAKFKNLSFEFQPGKQIGNIFINQAKKISHGFYQKMVRESVAATRIKMGEFLYKRFKKRIQGSNPITKELLKVIKTICSDMGTLERYVKFSSDALFSITVEFTIFSLDIFDMRTRYLRSKYYRKQGPVLVDRPYTGAQRRRNKVIKKVYIQQQYRQKQGKGERYPGMGWLVEFGRVNTGWINPRDNDSQNITPYALPRIEGERKGKAIYSRKKTRKMLLIWDKRRGGYIFRPKAKYGTAPGKEALYSKDRVIDGAVEKYIINTLQKELASRTNGGRWNIIK